MAGGTGALIVAVVLADSATPLTALAAAVLIMAAVLAALVGLELVKVRRITAAAIGLPPARDVMGHDIVGHDSMDHAEHIRRLSQSRRAIVDAFEIERARIERDLHDGAQQYLVASSMKVGEAALALDRVRAAHPEDRAVASAAALLTQAQDDTDAALAALRETVAGVHSRLLAEQGLEPALRELAARVGGTGQEVTLRIPHRLPNLPPGVASAAWFFASEALTNAVKYAPRAPVSLVVAADRALHVSVVDEGPGGARLLAGHGLAGMRERLGAFGGELLISSPEGGPTSVSARIPLLLNTGDPGVPA